MKKDGPEAGERERRDRPGGRPSHPIGDPGHDQRGGGGMCFKAWGSGWRQVYDPVAMEIKAG